MVAKGAKRAVVDYNSASSLSAALRGVDVVVSAFSSNSEGATNQEALARASKEAGVKIFVPSDYGAPAEGSDRPVFVQKKQFKNKFLRELGLPYAMFYTGLFTDLVLVGYVCVLLAWQRVSADWPFHLGLSAKCLASILMGEILISKAPENNS